MEHRRRLGFRCRRGRRPPHGAGGDWSALKLSDRTIKNNAYILTFGARVFHRDGETYPKFVVKVNGTVIRGIGQTEDWFYVDTDETQYCSYDLSAYVGQTVTVEIGIIQGTHAVVQVISFTGTSANKWENKAELLDEQFDPWILTGNWDAGVGEGFDIKNTGSMISNTFVIGKAYNSRFLLQGARVPPRRQRPTPTQCAGAGRRRRACPYPCDRLRFRYGPRGHRRPSGIRLRPLRIRGTGSDGLHCS